MSTHAADRLPLLRLGPTRALVAGASILALRGAPEHAPEPATGWLQSTLPTAAG
jgi:hypothetical protein